MNIKHALKDTWFPIVSEHINISKLRSGPKWPLVSNPLTIVEIPAAGQVQYRACVLHDRCWIGHMHAGHLSYNIATCRILYLSCRRKFKTFLVYVYIGIFV